MFAFDNSLVVGDNPVLKGHVEVAAYKHALALDVNVFDGFFVECVHKNILQIIIISVLNIVPDRGKWVLT